MSYTILAYDDSQVSGLSRFLVDNVGDINNLPINCKPGSKAIVANSGAEYILNNQRQWKLQPSGRGGGSGIGTIIVTDTPDSHGGIIKEITAIDISDTTATAEDVAQDKVFYTANGTRTIGTASNAGESGDDSKLYKLLSGTITDEDIDWSKISFLRNYSFINCTNLTKIENPALSSLPNRGFQYCNNIKNAEITCTDYSQTSCVALFSGCSELLTAKLNFTNQNYDNTFGASYIFENCTKLNTVILTHDSPKTLKLRANLVFYKCTALRTLVLKTRNMVVLESGQNADSWGGIWNNPTNSTIYVPSSLISSYKRATNWVGLYNKGVKFVAIEGSVYE